jgi:hypothetical protein
MEALDLDFFSHFIDLLYLSTSDPSNTIYIFDLSTGIFQDSFVSNTTSKALPTEGEGITKTDDGFLYFVGILRFPLPI